LTEFTEEYNGFVSQLHSNISTLKVQLKQSNETIKQLRKELSMARQKNGVGNSWAELDDGRDN
jgi:flagellar biosynthesis chaperone FliJ